MARKPESKAQPARTRRTAEEAGARSRRGREVLVAAGPAGIRLQEVAADVGVSHPTVLHHFGSREGLIQAVVARALDLCTRACSTPCRRRRTRSGRGAPRPRLETMVKGGHARTFLWLALSGYPPTMEELRVRSFAEAVHEIRRGPWEGGRAASASVRGHVLHRSPPGAGAALDVGDGGPRGGRGRACGARRFRAWLAKLIHQHLQKGERANPRVAIAFAVASDAHRPPTKVTTSSTPPL